MEAYPLYWPLGEPRTKNPKRSRFVNNSLAKSRDEVLYEITKLNGKQPIISTNIPVNKDGMLRSDYQRFKVQDTGVAVYFIYGGEQVCLSCDTYDKVYDNLKAIARTLEALRQISRDGVSDFLKKAFQGFTAIEAPKGRNCWQILGVPTQAAQADIINAYREKAKKLHPDAEGGSHEAFTELQAAYKEALSRIPC